MDLELESLLTKYQKCLELLSEINLKAEKVSSSEVIANHLTQKNPNDEIVIEETKLPALEGNDSSKKINDIINKLRSDIDLASKKRLVDVEVSKSAVQSYIDNTIWRLFSRTELQNNDLLCSNDTNRKSDKKHLLELTSTLLEFEKKVQESNEETVIFSSQLHEWMLHVMTIYLRISTNIDKNKLLLLLISTPKISSWAIPLIQFNITNRTETDDYIQTLDIIFCNNDSVWTEDDYLMVLDQLAIDYNYNKVIESMDVPDLLFDFTLKLTTCLTMAVANFSQMNSLMKRLSQTVIQISILLVDTVNEKEWRKCQPRVDTFLNQLVLSFYNLKQSGWFFLPNIPFKAMSTESLWKTTADLLQINTKHPSSLNDILGDHLPNITRFQYELHDNQMLGYFMLSCLTNISLAIQENTVLSTCIVSVIAYTLFTVAFIDKDLREVFYKDVRDSLTMMCRYHSFIIPLLFQWTIDNLNVMERMSLYLFHSIRLDQWDISKDDLKKVHKLISSVSATSPLTSQQTAQLQLGKHILSQLNYGYKHDSIDPSESKSQPWHQRKSPYLSYDIHEEIAFILLNVCQQFQPLPDASRKQENKGAIELVGSVMSSYLPIPDQIQLLKSSTSNGSEIIQWAWSIAVRLKLYDCPVSSKANDIEKSIDLPFLKLVLNSHNTISASHSALVIYISFMLSVTSRHFLRFESSDGWMKLLVILKRGKSEAVIHMFSEIVPSFVYMHGDDFFNDESLVDLFRHMVELKTDPMLVKGAKQLLKKHAQMHGIGLIIGSHLWQGHLIDSMMSDSSNKGFSYIDLMMHSWLKTLFRRTDWMWQPTYVSVVDILCKFAFTLQRNDLIYHMLEEEQKRMETTKIQHSASSPRLTRFLKNMVVSDDTFSTLLIGEWSMLKANTFNKTPGVENQYFWFAFQVLSMETVAEKPALDEISQMVSKQLSTSLTDDQHQPQEQQQNQKFSIDLTLIYKSITTNKEPLEFFACYRWLQHILTIPMDHPLLPLYCQMFLVLYYQVMDSKHEVTLGYLFFHKKKDQIAKLRDHIANIQTFYGQKMSDEALRRFYYAIWLWLGNEELLNLEVNNLHSLPSHYEVPRLESCYSLSGDSNKYWLDLVNMDQLEQEFMNFSWEGADKFRTDNQPYFDQQSLSNTDDLVSLSTTARRLKFITDESMIVPLPQLVINTPSSSTSEV